MAQDSLGGGAVRFNIGQVISTSIAVFLRNLMPFTVITVIVGIPYILVSLLGGASLDPAEIEQTGQLPSGFWGMAAITMLIFILTYALTQSALIYGTVQDLRGQRASFGDCLSRGLSALPRVMIAALLASIAVAIAQWVVSFVIGLLGLALGGAVLAIVNLAVMLIFTAFACVLSAVGYYYLRAEKEGIIIDDIARVFD